MGAGVRIRIGNTDAEGRMAMVDVLCKAKEQAVGQPDPHLFTVATLTGHAVLAVGPYTIVMDNGPARHAGIASIIQSGNQPSSRTPRGHQLPGAFLQQVSGLDKHQLNSESPLKYSHLDIAGSAGELPHPTTGSSIAALVKLLVK